MNKCVFNTILASNTLFMALKFIYIYIYRYRYRYRYMYIYIRKGKRIPTFYTDEDMKIRRVR